jgi:hypothetical protein
MDILPRWYQRSKKRDLWLADPGLEQRSRCFSLAAAFLLDNCQAIMVISVDRAARPTWKSKTLSPGTGVQGKERV